MSSAVLLISSIHEVGQYVGNVLRFGDVCVHEGVGGTHRVKGSMSWQVLNIPRVCAAEASVPTCFVASALAASSKVKGLPHCQLRKMGVGLVDVCSRPLWDELTEAVPIVSDLAMHLYTIAGLTRSVAILVWYSQ